MNTNITIRRILAVVLSLCLILPGTAYAKGGKGKKNFNEGKKYESSQQWDMAAQSYALAVSAEPNNPEYRLHYLRALQQASLMYIKRGDSLAEQNDYAGWDSFAQLNLITLTEAKFSITLSLEESLDIRSANDLLNCVRSHLK